MLQLNETQQRSDCTLQKLPRTKGHLIVTGEHPHVCHITNQLAKHGFPGPGVMSEPMPIFTQPHRSISICTFSFPSAIKSEKERDKLNRPPYNLPQIPINNDWLGPALDRMFFLRFLKLEEETNQDGTENPWDDTSRQTLYWLLIEDDMLPKSDRLMTLLWQNLIGFDIDR